MWAGPPGAGAAAPWGGGGWQVGDTSGFTNSQGHVDWASLAKQWIQHKEPGIPGSEVVAAPSPPTIIDPNPPPLLLHLLRVSFLSKSDILVEIWNCYSDLERFQ